MDGTQARLKLRKEGMNFDDTISVERVDGTQARLKLYQCPLLLMLQKSGKGGWDSGEIETSPRKIRTFRHLLWKGWMGLRRD